jgi:hypothetical protein
MSVLIPILQGELFLPPTAQFSMDGGALQFLLGSKCPRLYMHII